MATPFKASRGGDADGLRGDDDMWPGDKWVGENVGPVEGSSSRSIAKARGES